MGTVFRKTSKGLDEVFTRANHLSPRLRAALIVVDGQRNEVELHGMIPAEPDSAFARLQAEGFIEPVPEQASVPAPAPAPRKEPSLDSLRREVVRALNEHLGPAAESLALKVERAQSKAELQSLVMAAAQTLRSYRGNAVADAFVLRFLPNS